MKKALIFLAVAAAAVLCSVLSAPAYAENAPEAPGRVWYRPINHDKVSLKWDEVEDADGYLLYKINDSGKTEKKVILRNTYTLSGLKPGTGYTYAVTAVRKNGIKTFESGMCRVSFTTPEEWYYTRGNGKNYNDKDYDNSAVYRRHYDGSGLEKFDCLKVIHEKNPDVDYMLHAVSQHGGYVYIYLDMMYVCDDVVIDCFRFNNDGTYANEVMIGGKPDNTLFADDDTAFIAYSTRLDSGGEIRSLTKAYVEKTVTDKKGNMSTVVLYKGEKAEISDIVRDDDYIYYFTTPYRGEVFDYDGAETENKTDDTARLWRSSLNSPDEITYDKNGYIVQPAQEDVTQCIAEMPYTFEDTIDVIGIRDGYIYYLVHEGEKEDGTDIYSFYRISVKDGAKPEKLVKISVGELTDVQLYDRYIYLFGDNCGYRIDTEAEKHSPEKIYTADGRFFSYDAYRHSYVKDNAVPVEIDGGYFYIHGYDTIYHRISLDGTDKKTSDKPFEWR